MAKKIYIGADEKLEVLDYIESTGTQYIDTGIYADINTIIEIEAMCTDTSTESKYPQITGAKSSYHHSSAIQVAYALATNQIAIDYGTNGCSNSVNVGRNTKFKVHIENNNITINDTKCTQNGTFSGTCEYSLWIFDCNDAGKPERGFVGRIYSYKIFDGNTLIRDFIPVIDGYGIPCLYDKVTKSKFYNIGTGEFGAGIETGEIINIGPFARRVKKIYLGKKNVHETLEVLDYIESTGTQYIDTGFRPKPSTRIKMDFKFNNTSTKQQRLWGTLMDNAPTEHLVVESYINGSGYLAYSYNNTSGNWVSTGKTVNTSRHIYELDGKNGVYKLDGTTIATLQGTATYTSVKTLRLLSEYGSNPKAIGQLYSCEIYDDDVLVRDFIPVIDGYGIPCLYDKVTQSKFYNIGTGVFGTGIKTGEIIEKVSYVKEVKKGYIGVNGLAKRFFGGYPRQKGNLVRNLSIALSAFGALNNYIICTGGRNISGDTTDSVEAFDNHRVNHVLPKLAQKRERHSCGRIGDYVLVISGSKATSASYGMTPTVETYNNALVRGEASSINTAVFDFGVGVNKTHLIQAGGCYYSGETNQAQSYDKNIVKTTITNLSEVKQYLTGGSIGEYIIFVGGYPTNYYIDIYDNNNVHTTVSRPSVYKKTTRNIGAASTEKHVFYFGGTDGGSTSYNTIITFDSNLISVVGALPVSVQHSNVFGTSDNVVASSGYNAYIYDDNIILKETVPLNYDVGSGMGRMCASNDSFALSGQEFEQGTVLFEF